MKLETKNLILTPVQVSDAEAIFYFFNERITTYMYSKPAKTIDDTLAFINHSLKLREEQKEIVFVGRLKYDDTFVGVFGLHHMDTRTPELGLWIQEGLFGKKLGIEGLSEVLSYARKNVPHDYFIYPVDKRNKASRNIPETLGGIYKKAYQKVSDSGNELQILEYWLYDELPKDYKHDLVIFQGDSITDCGRNRNDISSLGDGYVKALKPFFPNTKFINRGISGDRTEELMNRWKEDVISHQPDVLSLLCGVNDVWHYYHFGKPIDKQTFESNYKKLIEMTHKESPHTKIVLIEPFSFSIGAFDQSWRPMLEDFIHVVRQMAITYQLPLIKMDEHMKLWEKTYGAESLLGDGVHPSELGHELMAKTIKPYLKDILFEIQEKRLETK